MPHFPTHNPLKKELNLENIYQKLPIGIELYDEEGNLIDITNEINIREKLRAAEQEQRPALTADQRYSRFLKNRSRHIRHPSKKVRLQRNLRGNLCCPRLENTRSCMFLFQSELTIRRTQFRSETAHTGNLQFPDQCYQIHIGWRNQIGLPIGKR